MSDTWPLEKSSKKLRFPHGEVEGQDEGFRELFERHPRIVVELRISERTPNLVEEGLDVAVHTGELPDSALVAQKVAVTPVVSVATPAYIAK